jgi:methionyl-tRNA formyltransferase
MVGIAATPYDGHASIMTRTLFFGTPTLAVPALRALADITEVVGVVCQPDRPSGRGLALHEPAIKTAARELGLEVHQPVKVKTGNLHEWMAERRPDVALVLAYGRILPKAVLDAPRLGCMNLHASLLPKYRGAAPINWAIIAGENETGVSLMQMDEGLDTGPVLSQRRLTIGSAETAGELAPRIAELAAEVVREDLPRAIAGELLPHPQNDADASCAPPLRAEHLVVDFARSAHEVQNFVRGLSPRPGARSSLEGRLLRLLKISEWFGPIPGAPGTLRVFSRRPPLVACGQGTVEILEAQLEGRRVQTGVDLVNGRVLRDGQRLVPPSESSGKR